MCSLKKKKRDHRPIWQLLTSAHHCTMSKANSAHTSSYLIFVIFFTRTKFLENKIYTEKTRKLRQNTQKIANFLRYCRKIHSKLPIFRVKSVKIYTGQNKFTRAPPVAPGTNMRYEANHSNSKRSNFTKNAQIKTFLVVFWQKFQHCKRGVISIAKNHKD